MRKLVACALIMLGGSVLYALPVGNPAEASLLTWGIFFPGANCNAIDPCCSWFDSWSLRLGYYGDFVFNRNLELRDGGFGRGKAINKTQISTNAGYLALNIANKLDVFATLGASRISITTSDASWRLGGVSEGRLDWETFFSWSAGARGTLFEFRHFLFGVEGQYFQTSPDLTTYVNYENGAYTYFSTNNDMTYREWQAGLGVSYALSCFCPNISIIPYAAVKWAWANFQTNRFVFTPTGIVDSLTIFNLRAHKAWGYAVGVTGTLCNMVSLTAEGRWGDEKAFYINGNFRF